MKGLVFGVCLFCTFVVSGCAPNRFYLVNSEGIFTYNRHTGQLEFMWQTKSAPAMPDTIPVAVRDTIHR